MVSESKNTMIHNHVVSHVTGKFFAEYITKYLPSWKFQSQTTTETWIRMEQLFAEEFPGGEVNYYISIVFHTFKHILFILFLPGHQLSRGQGGPRGGAGQDGVSDDVSWHCQVSKLDSLWYSGRLQALQQGGPAQGEMCPAGIH